MNDDNDIFRIRVAKLEQAIDNQHHYLYYYAFSKYGQNAQRPNGMNDADLRSTLSLLWSHVLHTFKLEDFENLRLLKSKLYQLAVDWFRRRGRDLIVSMGDDVPEMPARPNQHMQPFSDTLSECWRFWRIFPRVQLTDGQKLAVFLHGHKFTIKEIIERCQSEGFADMPRSQTSMDRLIQRSKAIFRDHLNGE
jgi:hypothetical protein